MDAWTDICGNFTESMCDVNDSDCIWATMPCDCNGNVEDDCGECNGDGSSCDR